jgi:outer membrane protein
MRQILYGVAFTLIASLAATKHANAQSIPNAPEPRFLSFAQLDTASIAKSTDQDQTPDIFTTLSLADAEAHALKNEPRLLSEQLRAQAATKQIAESRAAFFPQLYANVTAVEANGDTAVAAGALTTSSISTRTAGGASLVQLITDFGRTSNLTQSARYHAQAVGQQAESIRQSVLRDVDEAYYAAQAAESVRKTARAVLDFRQVALRQLTALAQSQLRSTLDVQFAQVLVSEAELAQVRAESNVAKAQAQLAAAMGEEGNITYNLTDQSLPPEPEADANRYVQEALRNRPDLKALLSQTESASRFARAERDLNYPTVNALAAGGEIPVRDSTLHRDYGAVGINMNVPLFNGGLYTARSSAAALEAKAANRDAAQQEVQIARDVRVAWADARDAYLQIQVAQRLVDETNIAMRLAQARYDAGLGGIVELNQAELNRTSALITAASARFDYMRLMAVFHFTLGVTP